MSATLEQTQIKLFSCSASNTLQRNKVTLSLISPLDGTSYIQRPKM